MRVLIACERSGVLREAFRRRGHNAYSCDLASPDDGSGYHLTGDAIGIMRDGCPWDLVIAHPPCTRLANSGSLRLYKGGKFANGIDLVKWQEMEAGALFFRRFFVEYSGKLCVENPIQHSHAREAHGCGQPAQIIQPFHFGDDASKGTGLWLRGVPPLDETKYFPPRWVCQKCKGVVPPVAQKPTACPHCDVFGAKLLPRWGNQTDSGQNRLGPSPERAQIRSQTYRGIAEAMAEQWGNIAE